MKYELSRYTCEYFLYVIGRCPVLFEVGTEKVEGLLPVGYPRCVQLERRHEGGLGVLHFHLFWMLGQSWNSPSSKRSTGFQRRAWLDWLGRANKVSV